SLRAVPSVVRAGTLFALGHPASEAARLDLYDAAGRRVRTLLPAKGSLTARWDADDAAGQHVRAGGYLARHRDAAGGGEGGRGGPGVGDWRPHRRVWPGPPGRGPNDPPGEWPYPGVHEPLSTAWYWASVRSAMRSAWNARAETRPASLQARRSSGEAS